MRTNARKFLLALTLAIAAAAAAAVWVCRPDNAEALPTLAADEGASEARRERPPDTRAFGGVGRPRPTPAAFRRDAADDSLRQLERDLLRAAAMTEPDARRRALAAACAYLAKTDPAEALALAARFELDDSHGALIERIVQQWASSDAPAAWAWVSRQPADESRDRLRASLVFVWSQSQPLAAARVVEEMAPGPVRDETSLAVLHQWARRDPTGALAWVERFPSGEVQDRALAEMESIVTHRLGRVASP